MVKWEKTYKKEDTDLFLIDLLKALKEQTNFYKIENIIVEKLEKETKYIVEIIFFEQKNTSKVYISKKTEDANNQITTKLKEKEVE